MPRRPATITQADVQPDSASVVYFVRIGKAIKIGFTKNIEKRLKAFMTSAVDVALLFTIPGDRSLEKKLHVLLAESKIARELFRSSEVLQFIEIVKFFGFERGIKMLENSTPAARRKAKEQNFVARVAARRQSKAELDAYYAGLVAERKQRLGW